VEEDARSTRVGDVDRTRDTTTRVEDRSQLERVSLDTIAREVGTPCYVYSAATIRTQYDQLRTALGKIDARLHYSVKANSSIAILALLRELGAGLDIVSGGELFRALKAGYTGQDIVFSGVGKTEREMEEALRAEVLLFNVESEQELHVLDAVANRLGKKAPLALRVNRSSGRHTASVHAHPLKGMKFSIPFGEALSVAGSPRRSQSRLLGLDMHVGSQISSSRRRGLAAAPPSAGRSSATRRCGSSTWLAAGWRFTTPPSGRWT
jgi:diaminopimelate decarboxylase